MTLNARTTTDMHSTKKIGWERTSGPLSLYPTFSTKAETCVNRPNKGSGIGTRRSKTTVSPWEMMYLSINAAPWRTSKHTHISSRWCGRRVVSSDAVTLTAWTTNLYSPCPKSSSTAITIHVRYDHSSFTSSQFFNWFFSIWRRQLINENNSGASSK